MPCGSCGSPLELRVTGATPSPVWAPVAALCILVGWFRPQTRVISSHVNADQYSAEDLGGLLHRFLKLPLLAALSFSVLYPLNSSHHGFSGLAALSPQPGETLGSTWFPSWHHFLEALQAVISEQPLSLLVQCPMSWKPWCRIFCLFFPAVLGRVANPVAVTPSWLEAEVDGTWKKVATQCQ